MKTRFEIRIDEPSSVNQRGEFVRPDLSCAVCSDVFQREVMTCMAYVSYDSDHTEAALGRICLRCRDAEPQTLRSRLRALAEIQWLQETPEPVCIYLKS